MAAVQRATAAGMHRQWRWMDVMDVMDQWARVSRPWRF